MGISKKELFECYYMDEIPEIFQAYAALINPQKSKKDTSAPVQMGALDFLGDDVEVVG